MALTITIGSKDYEGGDNCVLQRAVDDAAAAGGGVVEIPAGVYTMHDALHLRDSVRIVGEPGTVLLKAPSVSSVLTHALGYGHYEFAVAEPEKFRVGMGVHLTDERSGGFYDTVATIVHRSGDWFFINRKFNHDYAGARQGRVTSVYPLIEGYAARNVSVENLTLDGNPEETVALNGCRGAGVFLLETRRALLQGLEIKNYRGDGISFQQCCDIAVRDCHIHDLSGTGLHPGSGSVRYVMLDNRVHDNEGCGVFYCLRTSHSICRGNVLEYNGRAGISIGERDTDHYICDNTIRDNAGNGVEFRPPHTQSGDRVRLEDNRIGPNCAGDAEHEISIPAGLHQIEIVENAIDPGAGKALAVGDDCSDITFSGNTVSRRAQREDDVAGRRDLVRFTAAAEALAVGPEALPLDGAQHLNIPELPPWEAF